MRMRGVPPVTASGVGKNATVVRLSVASFSDGAWTVSASAARILATSEHASDASSSWAASLRSIPSPRDAATAVGLTARAGRPRRCERLPRAPRGHVHPRHSSRAASVLREAKDAVLEPRRRPGHRQAHQDGGERRAPASPASPLSHQEGRSRDNHDQRWQSRVEEPRPQKLADETSTTRTRTPARQTTRSAARPSASSAERQQPHDDKHGARVSATP
jgi:hypothetical protein